MSTSFRLGNSAGHISSASWELEVDGRAKARAASSAIRCPTLAIGADEVHFCVCDASTDEAACCEGSDGTHAADVRYGRCDGGVPCYWFGNLSRGELGNWSRVLLELVVGFGQGCGGEFEFFA